MAKPRSRIAAKRSPTPARARTAPRNSRPAPADASHDQQRAPPREKLSESTDLIPLDRSHDESGPIYLASLGIDKNRSSRAQLLAKVPEDQFETWLREQRTASKTPTLKAAHKFAKAYLESTVPASAKTNPREQPKQPKPEPAGTIVIPENPDAMLEEGVEHTKVLDRLLESFYQGGTIKVSKPDGRHAARLVAETHQLFKDLQNWHTQVK